MDPLCERVREALGAGRLLHAGDRVLVGVSGGTDSLVLLHVLHRLHHELGVTLAVVHVDHQLRPDSSEDAAFVEQVASQWHLPCTVVRRDVLRETQRRGLSLEDGARRVRYEAFLEVAKARAMNRLALAHTADDQAETVLMRILRGAGLTGLSAIPVERTVEGVTIVRPLLGVWRRELAAYREAEGLAVRHDPTNDNPRFLRNRIRAQLLPWLEESFNPQIKSLLNQLAEQCRCDARYLQEAARRQWKRLVKARQDGLAIRRDAFRKQPQAIQRQVMRLALQHLQGDLTGFEFRHWQEIERLLTKRSTGAIVDLPGQTRAQTERDWMVLRLVTKTPSRRPRTAEGSSDRRDSQYMTPSRDSMECA